MSTTINFEKAIEYIKSLPTVPDSALTPNVIIKWDKSKSTRNEWGGKTIETTPVFYYPKTGIVDFLKEAPNTYICSYLFNKAEDAKHAYYTNEKTSVTTTKPKIFSYYGNTLTLIMKGIFCSEMEKQSRDFLIFRKMENTMIKLFVIGYRPTSLKIFIISILINKL